MRTVIGLLERIERNIRFHRLFVPAQKIVVAVSGGSDSMVLLHVLNELMQKTKWRLVVAHLNHQLRGRSSDADERLVRSTAKKMGLQVIVDRARVREFAKERKISVEMAARKLRHDFLARAARRVKAKVVALAHHADDQVELFFLRLFRGSGGEGLSGMDWVNPSPADQRIKLVRPLLNLEREELRSYAAENDVEFREDATNTTLDFQRNRIRHQLLPLLEKKYQPAIRRTVLRAIETVGAESELIREVAEEWLRKQRKAASARMENEAVAFDALPLAVQRKSLHLQLREKGVEAGFELVEQLRLGPNKRIGIGTIDGSASVSLLVMRDSNGIVFLQRREGPVFDEAEKKVEFGGQGRTKFGAIQIMWRIQPLRSGRLPAQKAGQEFFDADKVGSRVTLRHWRPGDRFQPIGMKSAVKLQDIFMNERIPRARRHKLAIGVTTKGELFWVEGLRISERFKLTKETKRRLHWRWRRR